MTDNINKKQVINSINESNKVYYCPNCLSHLIVYNIDKDCYYCLNCFNEFEVNEE